jgi:hypothetical protein
VHGHRTHAPKANCSTKEARSEAVTPETTSLDLQGSRSSRGPGSVLQPTVQELPQSLHPPGRQASMGTVSLLLPQRSPPSPTNPRRMSDHQQERGGTATQTTCPNCQSQTTYSIAIVHINNITHIPKPNPRTSISYLASDSWCDRNPQPELSMPAP